MKSIHVPLNDPSVVILITNSNVKHDLGSSGYPQRRKHCEEIAKKFDKQYLRDISMEELKGKMYMFRLVSNE